MRRHGVWLEASSKKTAWSTGRLASDFIFSDTDFVEKLASADDCALRIGIFGGWFGTPPIWRRIDAHDSELIDGRKRAALLRGHVPSGLTLETPREIVRALCAAGEYERARSYIPKNIAPSLVAKWANIPIEWAARMLREKKQDRSGNAGREPRAIIRRARALLAAADAGEDVTAEDLRWVLGYFANWRKPKRT